jgi:hypothetical protein
MSNKQKCNFFSFSFTKSENRRAEQVLPGVLSTSGHGEEVGKGGRRVNMVQILCNMYVNGKMISVETIPGMGGCKGE